MSHDLITLISSGVIGSTISVIFTFIIQYKKLKDTEKSDSHNQDLTDAEFYRQKWLSDEDQIDKLRDRIRDLEDEQKGD